MCVTCGCSDHESPSIVDPKTGARQMLKEDHEHHHEHSHDHDHSHEHEHHHEHTKTAPRTTTIQIEQNILAKNDRLAEENRRWLAEREIFALNLIGGPGAGKTSLLERTAKDLRGDPPLFVIEGDQETSYDAERLQAAGCPVVQINTGAGCHLDALMTRGGLQRLNPPRGSLVVIENVGNLVCPSLFDLGEQLKVMMLSVTEGEDKPLKYPHAFRASEVLLLTKIDLLPHLSFDLSRCLDFVRQVNPKMQVFQLSATRGEGLGAWYAWLKERRALLRR